MDGSKNATGPPSESDPEHRGRTLIRRGIPAREAKHVALDAYLPGSCDCGSRVWIRWSFPGRGWNCKDPVLYLPGTFPDFAAQRPDEESLTGKIIVNTIGGMN